MSEIGLNRENVGQIAIVIVGPNMFVVGGVDQLDVHAHSIAFAADTPFQNGGNAERLADFTHVRRLPAIRHDRRARDHFQVADLGQVGENVVLDAVREISVLLFVAQIFKGQHSNRLVDLARRGARQQKKSGAAEMTRPIATSIMTLRRRGPPGAPIAGVVLIPSGVTSKAQARINAMGSRLSSSTTTKRNVQLGRSHAGKTAEPIWMMNPAAMM